MRLGFIGCGNMATAIIKGIITNGGACAENISIYDVYNLAAEKLAKETGAAICADEADAASVSDILFLAVKPNVIAEVLKKISPVAAKRDMVIISIAAGKTIEFISGCLKSRAKIIRVMPNINAKVGEAVSAYCCNEAVNEIDKKSVERLLSCFGKFISLDESKFPIFGVLGGCSPAFVYMFTDALARAGVKNGLSKKEALEISAQAVLGSAKMMLESTEHPWQLADNVCSPGGTTIEGVLSLQADGFEAAVHNAVEKAVEKDKSL